ncbi:MAG: prenyltransferase/squalene oxidase repeat-containing protein [Candidatus Lokiarchaeia archaeon]|nr:prenyltransferase/squalene oxidase repeat-containing protein [Candidatus Lokiarchaeia archaeon]
MKHKYRNFIIISFAIILTINAVPSVLGKTRRSYLMDFILNTEVKDEGFSNGISDKGGEEQISLEATAHALSILKDMGANLNDFTSMDTELEERIGDMFDSSLVNIYDLYYLLKSLNLLDSPIASSLKNRIYEFLNETAQPTGGFSFSNTTHLSSLTCTYYAIQIYSLIDQPIANISTHKNWVLSCNNTDGGYGGNQTLSSTSFDTSIAVFILADERFGDINDLVDIDKTLEYLKSFYVNDSANLDNYGGFLPSELAGNALLSSTYYCVKAISLIDIKALDTQRIVSWVLKHQNFEDGGFMETLQPGQSTISSIIASYHAFETLKTLQPTLVSLNNDIGMVEFNYLILGVVLGSIGLIIAIAVFLWKRRRI